jgi:hypothetical protein
MNGTLLNTYSWKTASQGIFQIFDTTADIEYIAPNATAPTVVYTKTGDQIGTKCYFFGVGNYLFVGGNKVQFKWDGPAGSQGVTNWGISAIASSTGATIAGAGASTGSGGIAWANPSNVTSTVAYATTTRSSSSRFSGTLEATNFGFGATAAAVGVQVTFNGSMSQISPNQLTVSLLYNGHAYLYSKTSSFASTTSTQFTFGSASDSWGLFNGIPASIVNSSTFGVGISVQVPVGSPSIQFAVDNVNINLFFNTAPTATPTGSGSFFAINGWTYVTAYGNPISGEISNASQPSLNTGPFNGKTSVQVALTASPDTQVSQIHVYRTTDSGGGSIFYELPNSPFPNTTANIQDTAFDTALNVNSQAAVNFQNTPPPMGLSCMEWFAGRLWGIVGNLLYFSTGPDSLSGLQQSNWNPVYVFVIPTSITRLTALPNGLLVQDLDEILVVRGTSTVSFTVNEFIRDTGLWNYNASDTDGSNVYMFTADRQFFALTASGMEEVGGGVIADQLQQVDPTQAYVTIYRSGLDAMVFLLDVANQVLYPFNIRQNAWCLPALLKFTNITAAGAVEIRPGVWKYLIGTGESIAQRDLATFTDLGTPYAPQVVVGTIQEADPGTLAKMENLYLEMTNAGSVPSVSILPNDAGVTLTNPPGSQITGKFLQLINPVPDPPTYGADPVNYRSLRYNWQSIATQIYNPSSAAAVKYVQILIQFASEAAQSEVLGLGLSGKQESGDPVATAPVLMGH